MRASFASRWSKPTERVFSTISRVTFLGREMECVGERPVQVLGELKRRGQAIDEEVLGVRRDDAVRFDAVFGLCCKVRLLG